MSFLHIVSDDFKVATIKGREGVERERGREREEKEKGEKEKENDG